MSRRSPRRLLGALAIAASTLVAPRVRAEVSEAAGRPDEQFDFMNLLTRHGLHDIEDETWNAYGQLTYISSWKPTFAAAYTNANGSGNSLLPTSERSWTGSLTLLVAGKLWQGGELYFVPEVIAEQPFSNLRGLGGAIQNFELQKTGSTTPTLYRSRVFLQQTFGLGGDRIVMPSNPMQLGTVVDSRRIVVRVGNFSVIDFFDKNSFAGDLRRQFFNMAFLTYAAYDFVADARGYTWGGMAALDWDDWAFRIGRFAPPRDPNSLPLTLRMTTYFGDQIELEHDHRIAGLTGAVRVLAYRNEENMGRFADALAAFRADPSKNAAACTTYDYGSDNAGAPDLCWVRKRNVKTGIGLNLEQQVTGDIGVFFRGMISDGQSEVYAFTSTDRSVSFGALAKGSLWGRASDLAGVGVGVGWISGAHADYLRAGGVDGFVGDGTIDAAPESVIEAFYSLNVIDSVWVSGDVQRIANPGFNADRGPVDVFGARLHAEF